MKRRNVLLGLGASAAGSGIVFGTGAFTQVEAERDITIRVNEDSEALLGLDAGNNIASVYNDGTSGELVIDTDRLSGSGENEGFNANATAQIGSTKNPLPDDPATATVSDSIDSCAFKLTNRFDTVDGSDNGNNEIDIKIDLTSLTDGSGTLYLIGTEYDSSGNTVTDPTISITSGSDNEFTDVPDGHEIYFAILIETGSSASDFDGTITFTAEPEGN